MKRNDKNIEREVDQTLSTLDSARRANAPPFFYTRLQARIRERAAGGERDASVVRVKRAFVIAGLALLVLLNAYSLWRSLTSAGQNAREQQIASFAEEYGLTSTKY